MGYLLVELYAREPFKAKFPNQEEETGLIIFGGSQWLGSKWSELKSMAVVGHLQGSRHIKGRWYSGFACCNIEFSPMCRWLVADVADREFLNTLAASSDKRRGHDRRKPEQSPSWIDEALETIQRDLEMK